MLAVGMKRALMAEPGFAFEGLKSFQKSKWLFGYLGYDLKNELEKLSSDNADYLGFPALNFFEPEHLITFQSDGFTIESEVENLIETIWSFEYVSPEARYAQPIASVDKKAYIDTVEALRNHIEEGDCYEINYCQEFHGEIIESNPVETFLELNRVSPKPFACLQKFHEHYILCASPERFIKTEGTKVISQPIKGTRPRGANAAEDEVLKQELRSSEKELAENMMIVDLVRNDLARTAKTGSVKVEEMFGIYSFQQVHQMISTVVSEMKQETDPVDVIQHAFPMGSMTGAPKVKVMELIEHYENTKRGAFSGAAGYFSPSGAFDFNVLIRSLFLNTKTMRYSFQVGSAITYDAIAEQEYDECLIKAKAIFEVLNKK